MWLGILEACVPILVALIGIIPAIVKSRQKTQLSIDALQKSLDAHIKDDEEERARNRRYRILRFYDEMCAGKKFSENHFESILDDISDYEAFCHTHPDFRNGRGRIAMEEIQHTYKVVKNKGGFLNETREEKVS